MSINTHDFGDVPTSNRGHSPPQLDLDDLGSVDSAADDDSYPHYEMTESQMESQTQSQDAMPVLPAPDYSNTWGRFVACTPGVKTIELSNDQLKYTIGRAVTNDVHLANPNLSSHHATVWLNPDQDAVMLLDKSRNGTYVDNKIIGANLIHVLHNGSEVSFGRPNEEGLENFKYIFKRDPRSEDDIGGELAKLWQFDPIVLGRGAFGTVRRVTNRRTAQWAAVKMLPKSKYRGDGYQKFLDSFMKEVNITASLDHPNIVRFMGHDEDSCSLYILMELVEGSDLLTYIQNRNHLDEPTTRDMTRKLCEAMAYAHSVGVSHRDLKPENILLTKANPPEPKIADFGLAKMVTQETYLKTMCGTPAYLAPEVVTAGQEGYTDKVDSWSLGVIVCAALTGCSFVREFEDTDMPMIERLQNRMWNWSIIENSKVSDEARDWLVNMLHENAEERFSMTEALQHPWLRVEPTHLHATLTASFVGPNGNDIRGVQAPFANTFGAGSSFDASTARSVTTPTTPALSTPRTLEEQCSQDLENLRIEGGRVPTNSGGVDDNARGLSSFSSLHLGSIGSLTRAFPSLPGDGNMPYPDKVGPWMNINASLVSNESPIQISLLGSAWEPHPISSTANAVAGQDTIVPRNKRKAAPTGVDTPQPRCASSSGSSSSLTSLSDDNDDDDDDDDVTNEHQIDMDVIEVEGSSPASTSKSKTPSTSSRRGARHASLQVPAVPVAPRIRTRASTRASLASSVAEVASHKAPKRQRLNVQPSTRSMRRPSAAVLTALDEGPKTPTPKVTNTKGKYAARR